MRHDCSAWVLLLAVELRTDVPDLSTLTAARADLTLAAIPPFPPMSVTGLAPWASGDSVRAASAQGLFYGRLSTRPTPAAGARAAAGNFVSFQKGLPDASKGDVVYFFQRSATQVGSGSGLPFHTADCMTGFFTP
jgi:hypothetical protein